MMHIGLSVTPFGHHPAAWRGKSGGIAALDARHLAAQVQKAQDGGLDFVFFADHQGRRPIDDLSPQTVPFEPTMLVAALATVARRIGFVATAAMGQHEPYNLARRLASLDTISQGRTGWNAVPTGEAERDREYIEVVSGLWDSWEDDAFIYDKAAGRFFVPEKMHVLDHAGPHFTVRGPLNVNRSPQGKPVLALVVTPETEDLAARSAELAFLSGDALEATTAAAKSLRGLAQAQGRKPSDIRILATIMPWVGATGAAAQEGFDRLNGLQPRDRAISEGCDLIGTADDIADRLQAAFEGGGLDGFTVLPPLAPEGVDSFVDLVVPELRRRGVFRQSYEGATLRDHLFLDRPAHPAAKRRECA